MSKDLFLAPYAVGRSAHLAAVRKSDLGAENRRVRDAAFATCGKVASFILSPAFRKDATGARDVSHCLVDPGELAEWMLADGLNARLGLQIHKFIWEPSMKGV